MIHTAYTYMLASRPRGALYIGVTSDLHGRILEHKSTTGSPHTTRYNIKKLVWYEHHPDLTTAIKRENRLKKYKRDWKIGLIEQQNPKWQDLWHHLDLAPSDYPIKSGNPVRRVSQKS